MAITTVVKVTVTAYGDVNAAQECTATTNSAACFKRGSESLSSGANNFTVPTGAKTLIIEDGTVQLTVKGVTGDTGIEEVLLGQTMVLAVTAGASICIAADGAGTALFTWC